MHSRSHTSESLRSRPGALPGCGPVRTCVAQPAGRADRSARAAAADDLLSPATQIVASDGFLEEHGDIGQRIAEDRLELFVSTDPATALRLQFERLAPDFIALHDIGRADTLSLLAAVAGALGTRVQQLAIRRQGQGVALALLSFVEVPGQGGRHLRVYSTDVDTDTQGRRQMAAVLLGHARLGAVLVAELPPHALQAALRPLRDAIDKGPWPNRELLLVPQGNAAALTAAAGLLSTDAAVQVHVTPRAPRPHEAWTFITGAWNRVRQQAGDPASLASMAPTERMPLVDPPCASPQPEPATNTDSKTWTAYLQACAAIKGMVGACVFDPAAARLRAQVGGPPGAAVLMEQGLAMHAALAAGGRALGLGGALADATVTLGSHHLLLHRLPGQDNTLLHIVLDAAVANLTLASMQLRRIDTTVPSPT